MDIKLCEHIMEQALKYNLSQGKKEIKYIFHGGEPLLCGLEYFYEILKIETRLISQYGGDIQIRNAIQTNGFLLGDAWLDFFMKHEFGVGFSIDGDKELNFHHSSDSNSTERTLSNYRAANSKIKCGLLSVITNEHTKQATEFYEFYKCNEIHNAGLCYCFNEQEGCSVENERLAPFLVELFDLFFFEDYDIDIREFRNAMAKCMGKKENLCLLAARKQCGIYLTFDSKGAVFFCDIAYDKSRKIGDICKQDLLSIISGDLYQHEKKVCMANINVCENECSLFGICGGGCYRHDISSSQGTKNYFCDTYKTLYRHIQEVVGQVERLGD